MPKLLIAQSKRSHQWFCVVEQDDGQRSKRYGPFRDVKTAEKIVRRVKFLPVETEVVILTKTRR